jgi:YD repeat-containing protein
MLFIDCRFARNAQQGTKMTARTEKILLALVIAALTAAAATASETINYSYDARGRLVQVKHGGSVNNNFTANYQYDKADNRTNVSVTSPNPAP